MISNLALIASCYVVGVCVFLAVILIIGRERK